MVANHIKRGFKRFGIRLMNEYERGVNDCMNRIDSMIKKGALPGNGIDETAQRNGIVLCFNEIGKLFNGSLERDKMFPGHVLWL